MDAVFWLETERNRVSDDLVCLGVCLSVCTVLRGFVHDVLGEGEQVVEDLGVFGQLFFLLRQGFFAFAGQDERGFATRFVHGLQVARAVADQPGFGGVGFEAFEDVVNHAGLGFAAVAVVGGGVRAKPDAVDFSACLTDEAGEALICPAKNGMFRPIVVEGGRVVAVRAPGREIVMVKGYESRQRPAARAFDDWEKWLSETQQ